GLVDTVGVVVRQDVVRARDHASRATGAQPRGDHLVIEVLPRKRPALFLGRFFDRGHRGKLPSPLTLAKIADILAAGPSSSFEFFPPKTPAAEAQLEQALLELEPLRPSFVSVTYGAGGSTRERTHDLVVHINRDTTMTAMAHLTCAAHTRAQLEEIVQRYADAGIENVLAIGGDPPKDLGLPPGELAYAVDLVRLVREVGDFCVGV